MIERMVLDKQQIAEDTLENQGQDGVVAYKTQEANIDLKGLQVWINKKKKRSVVKSEFTKLARKY